MTLELQRPSTLVRCGIRSKTAYVLAAAFSAVPLAAALVGAVGVVAQPGCTVAGCDPVTKPDRGVPIPTGGLVEGSIDTWESNPVTGTWFDFPGQRTQMFSLENVPGIANRNVEEVIPYLSTDPTPLQGFGNFTVASGNIAEITDTMNTYSDDEAHVRLPFVIVHNDSCGQYYLRVVVRLTPLGSLPPPATPAAVPSVASMSVLGAWSLDAGPMTSAPSDQPADKLLARER